MNIVMTVWVCLVKMAEIRILGVALLLFVLWATASSQSMYNACALEFLSFPLYFGSLSLHSQ